MNRYVNSINIDDIKFNDVEYIRTFRILYVHETYNNIVKDVGAEYVIENVLVDFIQGCIRLITGIITTIGNWFVSFFKAIGSIFSGGNKSSGGGGGGSSSNIKSPQSHIKPKSIPKPNEVINEIRSDKKIDEYYEKKAEAKKTLDDNKLKSKQFADDFEKKKAEAQKKLDTEKERIKKELEQKQREKEEIDRKLKEAQEKKRKEEYEKYLKIKNQKIEAYKQAEKEAKLKEKDALDKYNAYIEKIKYNEKVRKENEERIKKEDNDKKVKKYYDNKEKAKQNIEKNKPKTNDKIQATINTLKEIGDNIDSYDIKTLKSYKLSLSELIDGLEKSEKDLNPEGKLLLKSVLVSAENTLNKVSNVLSKKESIEASKVDYAGYDSNKLMDLIKTIETLSDVDISIDKKMKEFYKEFDISDLDTDLISIGSYIDDIKELDPVKIVNSEFNKLLFNSSSDSLPSLEDEYVIKKIRISAGKIDPDDIKNALKTQINNVDEKFKKVESSLKKRVEEYKGMIDDLHVNSVKYEKIKGENVKDLKKKYLDKKKEADNAEEKDVVVGKTLKVDDNGKKYYEDNYVKSSEKRNAVLGMVRNGIKLLAKLTVDCAKVKVNYVTHVSSRIVLSELKNIEKTRSQYNIQ